MRMSPLQFKAILTHQIAACSGGCGATMASMRIYCAPDSGSDDDVGGDTQACSAACSLHRPVPKGKASYKNDAE